MNLYGPEQSGLRDTLSGISLDFAFYRQIVDFRSKIEANIRILIDLRM